MKERKRTKSNAMLRCWLSVDLQMGVYGKSDAAVAIERKIARAPQLADVECQTTSL